MADDDLIYLLRRASEERRAVRTRMEDACAADPRGAEGGRESMCSAGAALLPPVGEGPHRR